MAMPQRDDTIETVKRRAAEKKAAEEKKKAAAGNGWCCRRRGSMIAGILLAIRSVSVPRGA